MFTVNNNADFEQVNVCWATYRKQLFVDQYFKQNKLLVRN